MAISSPGVEVREIDLSLRAIPRGGTSVLVPGFAQHGPTDEVFALTSLTEFERVYGRPTNAPERYFYQAAKAVFNSSARLLATRLPYGSGGGLGYADNIYTALFYPVFPVHEESVAGHPAGRTGATAGESSITSVSAASAAFTSSGSVYGATGPGVSLSGASGDQRLDFNTNLRENEGLSAGYIFGKPSLLRMSKEQYQDLREGNFTWQNFVHADKTFSVSDKATWGHAGVIVTNMSKSVVNDKYEGFYLGLTDNSQMNPATDYDSIVNHYTVTQSSNDLTLSVPESRRNFPLSGTSTSNDDSISETLENIPRWDVSVDDFNDTLVVGLFRMKASVFSTDTLKLDYSLAEGYVGSLDSRRRLQNPGGGNPETFFLGDIEDGSTRLEITVNPYISFENGSWVNPNGNLPTKFSRILTGRSKRDSHNRSLSGSWGNVETTVIDSLTAGGLGLADSLVPVGDYVLQNQKTQAIGAVPDKLNRIFRSVENLDLVNVDLTVEAGLGTIYAGAKYNQSVLSLDPDKRDFFDDMAVMKIGAVDSDGVATGLYQTKEGVVTSDGSDDQAYSIVSNYRSVVDEFVSFAEDKRKDHMFIADPLRPIFVQGQNGKVLDFDKTRTFTQFVYWPLRHLYSKYNTSYMSVYANWGKHYDGASDKQHWCPFSPYAAGTHANNDVAFGPWYAPAGFTRGRFGGLSEIAVIPAQKHRDQLYKINVNPVTNFPGEGFVIFGQKTMFRKPSAFDRINVRRLFLALEKYVRSTMKYFIFEPNTLLTRTKVLNTLTPEFNNIRNQQGVYDYLIICDNRNNGPAVVDNNELVVDIYIKPVRSAETVLVNFFATRTGQDFNEIIS